MKNVRIKKNREIAAKYEESTPDPFRIGSWRKPARIENKIAPFQPYSPAIRIKAKNSMDNRNTINFSSCRFD
jgi:hypothetical protein